MATMIVTTMGARRVIGLSNRHCEPPGYGCQQSGTLVPESGLQPLSELAAGLAAYSKITPAAFGGSARALARVL